LGREFLQPLLNVKKPSLTPHPPPPSRTRLIESRTAQNRQVFGGLQLVTPLFNHPFVTFLVYMAVLDLGEYWRHRLQHRLPWWWALHSLHHDQRQMTLWSDDRNHILDDILAMVWSGTIAMLIGVPPGEFPLVLIGFRLVESLSHTNVRLGFGAQSARHCWSARNTTGCIIRSSMPSRRSTGRAAAISR
ncbi:MAG: sterol desaturase family protein, partial [Nevskiales bacterium]